ncbi:MAG: hypothetical protein ACXV8Q_00295 [Methylobacter sp.]
MSTKQPKKNKLPTAKYVQENKEALADYLKKVVNGEVHVAGTKETIMSRLELIGDVLGPLKDAAIPYSTLSAILAEKIGLTVSPQTLRSYCQNQLGFPKSDRKTKNVSDAAGQAKKAE